MAVFLSEKLFSSGNLLLCFFFRENPQTKTTTFLGKKTGYLHHFCLVKGLKDTVVNCWHAPTLGGV